MRITSANAGGNASQRETLEGPERLSCAHRVLRGTVGTVQRSATGNGTGRTHQLHIALGELRGSRMAALSALLASAMRTSAGTGLGS